MRTKPMICALLIVAAALWAVPRRGAGAPTTKRQIAESLRRTVSVDFQETPLDEAANYMRELLGVNIVLDDEAEETKFITLQLREVPASSVLHWITRLTDLEYTITDHAVYIAPQRQIALTGQAYFRQYDVTDLLVPLEGALRNGDDDDDDDNDDDDDDDNDNGNRRTRARNDLMDLILIFTGGPSNWDHFAVMGADGDDNEDERVSEEDMF